MRKRVQVRGGESGGHGDSPKRIELNEDRRSAETRRANSLQHQVEPGISPARMR
jgi:hypothetical protein